MISNLKPYPAMKDSGVPWLGKVPDSWNVLRGRHLFEIKKRIAGEVGHPVLSVTQTGLRVKDVHSGEGQVSQDYSKYQIVKPGEIVMNSMDLLTGGVGIADSAGVTSPDYRVFAIRDGGQCCDRYVLHVFRTLYANRGFYAWGQGSAQLGRWRLPRKRFNEFPFPIPPLPEQAAIVRFLDHADRRIKRYIRAKQELIKLLEEQKQAIIHRAVTRGLDSNVRLKPSGVEWLGEVPEHWEIRRAKALCSAIIDCKNRTPEVIDGGSYTVVRTTCIRDGRFDPTGGYNTDEKNYLVWTARGAPRTGDVFFTREAPAGEACIVPDREDLCMGQRMMYFRPDPELLNPRFLLLSIYGPLTRTYVELATNGSTVGHLRLGQVYALPILWCPLVEQQAIVAHVDETTQDIERACVDAHHEIDLLREYRTRLIADVVTGKLDVREAAAKLPDETDEPESLDDADYVEGEEGSKDTNIDAVPEEAEV